jgi:hypothetical protein
MISHTMWHEETFVISVLQRVHISDLVICSSHFSVSEEHLVGSCLSVTLLNRDLGSYRYNSDLGSNCCNIDIGCHCCICYSLGYLADVISHDVG